MQLTEYQIILLFAVGGLLGAMGPLLLGKLIRPYRPNEEKLSTYECGEDPTGTAWGNFNIRFYVIALAFVLFETELIFLFPWAIVFGNESINEITQGAWGWLALVEMSAFVVILALGLAYVWRKGLLDWEKPDIAKQDISSAVPEDLYAQINSKYASKQN